MSAGLCSICNMLILYNFLSSFSLLFHRVCICAPAAFLVGYCGLGIKMPRIAARPVGRATDPGSRLPAMYAQRVYPYLYERGKGPIDPSSEQWFRLYTVRSPF